MKTLCRMAVLTAACLSLLPSPMKAQDLAVKTEIGTMHGASYRIDMPKAWNGVLLVYYHGYSEHPVIFKKDEPNGMAQLAQAGFAVIQSGYSEAGFALERAVYETEMLREYTVEHYGQPKETYVLGHSMGGQLTMITMESYPSRYDGALPLCGLLEPTNWLVGRGAAMRAAFDFYYPGVLPGPVGIPDSAALDEGTVAKVKSALQANPTGLKELMGLAHFKTEDDLADGMVFTTFILRDFEQKLGASILNNANFLYAGGPDDNALNDGVKRYHAPDAALAYLKTWYTPTGVLLKPMLAVHTTYDPIIPADTVRLYAEQVDRAGSSANFVQQYVKADGHCHISPEETVSALNELITWKHTGKRPEAGLVPTK